jgi:hypothetical protein
VDGEPLKTKESLEPLYARLANGQQYERSAMV